MLKVEDGLILEQFNRQWDIAEQYGDSTIFMGEDMVAGAFGMNIPLKANGHQDKLLDMLLCEAVIIHSATVQRYLACDRWPRFNSVVSLPLLIMLF